MPSMSLFSGPIRMPQPCYLRPVPMPPILKITAYYAFAAALAVGLWSAQPAGASHVDPSEVIRDHIERAHDVGLLSIGPAKIRAHQDVAEFYEQRGFQRAWTDLKDVEAMKEAINDSIADGLNPADLNADTISALSKPAGEDIPERDADLDVLLTDALFTLAHHLAYGKVDPETLDRNWNLRRPLSKISSKEVEEALGTDSIKAFFDRQRPDSSYYRTLRAALRSHRQIAASGGWPSVPPGESLKPGMTGTRVVVLRRRLAASGDLVVPWTQDPAVFDAELEDAVRHFQERHGLEADGVVGKNTLAALNVSVEERIDQIRVNLERARWVLRTLSDEFVVINIAGFRAYFVRDRKILWQSRAIVGRPYRKTPLFTAHMTYVVINPTWTVPPTILRNDVLPKIRKDVGYLSRENIRVIDRNGRIVDPSTINWPQISARGFPYRLVQQPGPGNALGRIKFMFPNRHAVYLHDTPHQKLFERPDRTFSSGCIRLQDPLGLADLVLAGDPEWTRAKVEQIIASGEMTTVNLKRRMPVLVLYWTVDPDPTGTVRFWPDVYDRDAAVLRALEASS